MSDCIQTTLGTEARTPAATYRLQMHEKFTFEDAQKILPYLKKLGISDAYLSPIFEARPHSMHGYDVVRHDCLNPELGGEVKFAPFSAAIKEHGMGVLLDTVPNHMGVGNNSIWWQDVLENGRASEYSGYFDIDWEPLKPDMQNKLLLPILGVQYGEALESKQLQVKFEDGRALIAYFDHLQPIAPRTLPMVFPRERDAEFGVPASFRRLLDELSDLPVHESTAEGAVHKRRERLKALKPQLTQALNDKLVQPCLAKAAEAINGKEGDPRSFDALHALLEQQPYRLAFWRTSSEQINYRRFFDVNDLVGLRMEYPEVFAKTHLLIRKMLANGDVTGLRIDHCDGMFNPHVYLEQLQMLFVAAKCKGPVMVEAEGTPNGIERSVVDALKGRDWTEAKLPLYCVVEKILEPGEILPHTWAVQGTSGYDFVHFANQFFIQPRNKQRFDDIYAAFIDGKVNPSRIVYESKRNVMFSSLSSETAVLGNLLSQLARKDRRVRDFTDNLLQTVIRETIASFPIYRTYIDERGKYSEEDTRTIRTAIRLAKRRNPDVDASAFDYLQNMLLLDGRGAGDAERDEAQLYFALKFQQLTGPVMAKGVEDTSFYVYFRFLSSNEVGSAMDAFGLKPEVLHKANADRLQYTPHALLTTSTHDTKRSEDVRNRLNVLSEMPDAWQKQVTAWAEANAALKTTLDDGTVAPDANEEYMIYQTIVGAWPWAAADQPGFAERVKEYLAKALSEGKVNVSWINPRPEYTEAVQNFVDRLLTPAKGETQTRFVGELEELLTTVKVHGAVNSLAQVVLKATSPGVPDFYQGTDMWDLSLVDPDNRRPVNYETRVEAVAALEKLEPLAAIADVLGTLEDGRVKLLTMHRTLAVRNAHLKTFLDGAYTPLEVSDTDHAFAYLRGEDVLVVVPRFTYTLCKGEAKIATGKDWAGLSVQVPASAATQWVHAFTGKQVSVENGVLDLASVLADFPVAILTRA
ncbi:malto-oligosyltrehalose synthase [Acidipila sp. EB88]|uniref:malto-oligosyltrehalose synthase n=1 Tax=Acidipila sp. EB88 TaxID=2305226 RepID=UPI000F5EAD19|nr:malto-oligosyltrehalose synthase [Acidipila sp. EB88]RRA47344.1 malto-oligosyltrehalose synthase [Acidipila sp. EB88]